VGEAFLGLFVFFTVAVFGGDEQECWKEEDSLEFKNHADSVLGEEEEEKEEEVKKQPTGSEMLLRIGPLLLDDERSDRARGCTFFLTS
jgi:hypothetical protein